MELSFKKYINEVLGYQDLNPVTQNSLLNPQQSPNQNQNQNQPNLNQTTQNDLAQMRQQAFNQAQMLTKNLIMDKAASTAMASQIMQKWDTEHAKTMSGVKPMNTMNKVGTIGGGVGGIGAIK